MNLARLIGPIVLLAGMVVACSADVELGSAASVPFAQWAGALPAQAAPLPGPPPSTIEFDGRCLYIEETNPQNGSVMRRILVVVPAEGTIWYPDSGTIAIEGRDPIRIGQDFSTDEWSGTIPDSIDIVAPWDPACETYWTPAQLDVGLELIAFLQSR